MCWHISRGHCMWFEHYMWKKNRQRCFIFVNLNRFFDNFKRKLVVVVVVLNSYSWFVNYFLPEITTIIWTIFFSFKVISTESITLYWFLSLASWLKWVSLKKWKNVVLSIVGLCFKITSCCKKKNWLLYCSIFSKG